MDEAHAPTARLVDWRRYSDTRALDAPEQPDTRIVNSARRREMNPSLGVGFGPKLNMGPTDLVAEVVIVGAGYRGRLVRKGPLFGPWQKAHLMLAAEQAKHPVTRHRRAALTRHRQDQPGDITLIKSGDHFDRAAHPRNKIGRHLGVHRTHGISLAKRSKRGRDNRGGVQSGLGILDHRGVVVDKTVR